MADQREGTVERTAIAVTCNQNNLLATQRDRADQIPFLAQSLERQAQGAKGGVRCGRHQHGRRTGGQRAAQLGACQIQRRRRP